MTPAVDREQWVNDLLDAGYTLREAQVVVRLREGRSVDDLARDLGISKREVQEITSDANQYAQAGLARFLLVYGPLAAHANLSDYPQIRAELQEGLDVYRNAES